MANPLTSKDIIANYRKEHGKGTIGFLSDDIIADTPTITTGCLKIDHLIGNGIFSGFPEGQIVELYGPEASMKSTIAMYAIANYLSNNPEGRKCGYLDAEQTFNRDLSDKIGIAADRLVIAQPNITEDVFTLLEGLVNTSEFGVIVVDSIAAMTPRAEFEGEMGESKMGLQARLMSQGLRKVTAAIKRSNTCVIFVNQLRMKIGVMFGNPETTTGGEALKYYASIRLRCSSSQLDNVKLRELGRKLTVKLIKTKISAAAMGKKTEIDYMYDTGFNRHLDLAQLAVKDGIVERNGSWYSYDGAKLGQGIDAVVTLLEDNDELYDDIFSKFVSVPQEIVEA